MEHGVDNSLLVHRALSMAGASGTEVSPEGAEVAKLVRLALGGDATAFEQIIARYERRVMTVAIRMLGTRDDAQDAAQEVFYRAFKYLLGRVLSIVPGSQHPYSHGQIGRAHV